MNKHIEINLAKEVKDLNNENFKPLKKDTTKMDTIGHGAAVSRAGSHVYGQGLRANRGAVFDLLGIEICAWS